MTVVRAADRFRTSQPGIESWHVFAAGPHYDPARLGAGPLIGLDDHLLEPGAGFAPHGHRGVTIVSWVVSGVLEHRGATTLRVHPGTALVQRAGHGIRHEEGNASQRESLRLVQTTLMADSGTAPTTELVAPPVVTEGVRLDVGSLVPAAPAYIYVLDGEWDGLGPGDFAFVEQAPAGAGELMAWCVPSAACTQWTSAV